MTARTRCVRAVPVALASLLLPLLVAAPAHAGDTDQVGIGVARTLADEHGSFRVPAWTDAAGSALTGVTATVRDGSTSVATLTLTTTGDGFYAPAAPLTLTEDGGPMPHLGRYAIDVTATDDRGDTATRTDAGTLEFTLRPTFVGAGPNTPLTFSPPTLDLLHRATSVGGTVMGIQPGSGDVVELPASPTVEVTVTQVPESTRNDAQTVTVAADADGAFQTPPFAQPDPSSYRADVSLDGELASGTASDTATVPIAATAVHLTAKADRTVVAAGQPITVSGVARATASSSSAPISGAEVAVWLVFGSTGPDRAIGSTDVNTDSSGHFRATLVAAGGLPGYWAAAPVAPYVTGDEISGPLTVPPEASYSGTSITISSAGLVTARSTLAPTYGGQSHYAGETSGLEYSPNGRTGWRLIGHSRQNGDPRVTVTAYGYASGFCRLMHPMSKVLGAATSAPVRLARTPTRVQQNTASPHQLSKGGTVTVTGTFQQYVRGWRTLGNVTVFLYFRPTGSSTYRYEARGRADAHGRARLRAGATTSGDWLLQYFGDARHFNSGGTPDTVRVR